MIFFLLFTLWFLGLVLLLPRFPVGAARVLFAVGWTVLGLVGIKILGPGPELVPLGAGHEEDWFNNSPAKELLLFGAMLLGMTTDVLAGYLRARIRAKTARRRRMPPLAWESLALPAILSLGVFLLLWNQTAGKPLQAATVLFFYQNGFFWQTVSTTWRVRG